MINEDEFFDAVDAALDRNEQQEEERVVICYFYDIYISACKMYAIFIFIFT